MSEYGPILVIILQLIFLEGILSIDNAAVIGALVSPLPDNKRVEWPKSLQRVGEWLHPVLAISAWRHYVSACWVPMSGVD